MKLLIFLLTLMLFFTLSALEFKSGNHAMAYEINLKNKSIKIIAETAYDPTKEEGDSVYTLYWNDKTNFKIQKTLPFTSIKSGSIGWLYLYPKEVAKVKKASSFYCHRMEFKVKQDKNVKFVYPQVLNAPIYPLGKGKGQIDFNGKKITFKAPAKVTQFSPGSIKDIQLRESKLRIFGKKVNNKFIISLVYIIANERVEKINPALPCALIIGDSISMNYEKSVKKALKGKMNCLRIDGNSGDSNRGNSALQLWLGDIPGQKSRWQVVVLNHGLHDLKQKYDSANKKFDKKHQVEPAVYAKNIDRIFKYLTAKNYKVVWCTTTPVPNDSYGTFARKKDEDLVYNQTLVPVLKKYPQITVCDLNKLVRNSNSFDQWKKGNNVHFYGEQEVKLLGNAVAAAILEAAAKK